LIFKLLKQMKDKDGYELYKKLIENMRNKGYGIIDDKNLKSFLRGDGAKKKYDKMINNLESNNKVNKDKVKI